MEHSFRTAVAESQSNSSQISTEIKPLAAPELEKMNETCGFGSGKLQNLQYQTDDI